MNKKEFEPYGKEWKAELMKLKKEDIIDEFLKPALMLNSANITEKIQPEKGLTVAIIGDKIEAQFHKLSPIETAGTIELLRRAFYRNQNKTDETQP